MITTLEDRLKAPAGSNVIYIYRVHTGIMEKKMETTLIWGYIGIICRNANWATVRILFFFGRETKIDAELPWGPPKTHHSYQNSYETRGQVIGSDRRWELQ